MIRTCAVLSILLIYSCSFFDSTDEVPMYLAVNSVAFETQADEGSNSSKINDVSVFADGFSIGLFPVPSVIPVLDLDEDGISNITIFPVIRNNGIGNNPIQYPFYKHQEFQFNHEEDRTIELDLTFNYVENVEFIVLEDFEGSHIIKESIDQIPETEFVKSPEAIYGSFCGKVTTTADNPIFEEATLFRYPRSDVENSPIFLELDYKNDIPFQLGVITYNQLVGQRNYKIVLNESEDWNKIYIELTGDLGGTNYEEFQIVFGTAFTSEIGNVWIDNLKLLVLR